MTWEIALQFRVALDFFSRRGNIENTDIAVELQYGSKAILSATLSRRISQQFSEK